MKSIVLSLGIVLLSHLGMAQCCSSESSHCDFQKLADNSGFRAEHDLPGDYEHEGKGGMMTYLLESGMKASAFEVKAKGSDKYIFMFHEWWGLNDYIKREAVRYSEAFNVNVLALDLYEGQVAKTREEASKLMKGAKEDRIRELIQGAIKSYSEYQIATIGWCFGGGWSLQASMMAGKQSKACVIFYGMPEKDLVALNKLKAPVLGIWAKNDGWINAEVVDDFSKKMDKLNKSLENHSYDADHAFANPSNPGFDKEASKAAFKEVQDFFGQYFFSDAAKFEIPESIEVAPPKY